MPELNRRLAVTHVGPPLNHPVNEAEYLRVFASLAQGGADGIVVSDEVENIANLKVIVELAEKNRLLRCSSNPVISCPMEPTSRK
jgi:hypothetical protein